MRVPWALKRIERKFGTEQICTRFAEAAPRELSAFFCDARLGHRASPDRACELSGTGPILNYRDFERPEFKGRGNFDADAFLAALKKLATPGWSSAFGP